jgi:hypothetical protein
MWIAKPIRDLNSDEQQAWNETLAAEGARSGEAAPLAQTLPWGRAIDAAGGRAYVVFNPEERVGGQLFATADPRTRTITFECTNGPLLDYDAPEKAPRQLATFAQAASRLHSRFQSLVIRPRWRPSVTDSRLRNLPTPESTRTRAATLRLKLNAQADPTLAFSPRIQRTLRVSDKAGATARIDPVTPGGIAEFAPKMAYFGCANGFAVPPVTWFLALTDTQGIDATSYHLIHAECEGAEAQLLVAFVSDEAHYLFGHESRAPDARASRSPSAVAHRLAIRTAWERGLRAYDFNGALHPSTQSDDEAASHPYQGVHAFKSQFGASLHLYEAPEFRIALKPPT